MSETHDIYDWSVEAGSNINADKSTVNNIVSIFQGNPDVDSAFKELVLYIARQSSRGEISRYGAEIILNHLRQIYEKYGNNKNVLRESINKYLVLMKWVFETNLRGLRSFNDFLSRASRGRR